MRVTSLQLDGSQVDPSSRKVVYGGAREGGTRLFKVAQPVLDSIADKGIFHKNKAARQKSRLSAKVKALSLAA